MHETVAIIQLLFTLALPGGGAPADPDWAAARTVLEARLAALSRSDTRVFREGDRMVVELPAPATPEEEAAVVRELVHPGTLAFHPVASEARERDEAARRAATGPGYAPPRGHCWLAVDAPAGARELLVDVASGFGREILESVEVANDPVGAGVAFRVRPASVPGWRAFTRSIRGQRLAIVWGREVVMAPVVMTELGADGQITLHDRAEAVRLVRLCKAPAHTATLVLAERRPRAR